MPSRLAVVTGAGGALGGATVAALVAAGHPVVGVDRSAEALRALPGDVGREVADLSDADAAVGLIERVTASGPLGAVVHTVGAYEGGSATDTDADALHRMMSVNLESAWWVSRAAARVMGDGALVHVAARHGIEPTAGAAAYGVSKAALVQLTRILDVELRPRGVRVNVVVPRLIDTPANRAAFPASVMSRAVTPEAIAGVIAFLVGDAARPVSGAVIPV